MDMNNEIKIQGLPLMMKRAEVVNRHTGEIERTIENEYCAIVGISKEDRSITYMSQGSVESMKGVNNPEDIVKDPVGFNVFRLNASVELSTVVAAIAHELAENLSKYTEKEDVEDSLDKVIGKKISPDSETSDTYLRFHLTDWEGETLTGEFDYFSLVSVVPTEQGFGSRAMGGGGDIAVMFVLTTLMLSYLDDLRVNIQNEISERSKGLEDKVEIPNLDEKLQLSKEMIHSKGATMSKNIVLQKKEGEKDE